MKERSSNIELLRIFAMLIIIAGHSASHGIFHYGEASAFVSWSGGTGIAKAFSCLLIPGGAIGVGIFFMITGYFQIQKDRYSLKKLLLECLFYGILTSVIYFVLYFTKEGWLSGLSPSDFFRYYFLKNLFNPLSGGAWWFVTSYLLVMILSPVLNSFLRKLSAGGFIICITSFLIIWYGISYFTNGVYIQLERGILFYILGAYVRLYKKPAEGSLQRTGSVILYFVSLLSAAVSYYFLAKIMLGEYFTGNTQKLTADLLDLYIFAVATPACVYAAFRFFESFDIGSISVINAIAGTTLGIYLLHDSEILRYVIWNGILKTDSRIYTKALYPLFIVFITLFIFAACMAVDLLRKKCAEPFMIKGYEKLEEKVKKKIFK